jgi:hypothetical protein
MLSRDQAQFCVVTYGNNVSKARWDVKRVEMGGSGEMNGGAARASVRTPWRHNRAVDQYYIPSL